MSDVGVLIADDHNLYKIADRWKGDADAQAMVLLEDCKTGLFSWFDLSTVDKMERVYPDSE
jgi:hypothetical protein